MTAKRFKFNFQICLWFTESAFRRLNRQSTAKIQRIDKVCCCVGRETKCPDTELLSFSMLNDLGFESGISDTFCAFRQHRFLEERYTKTKAMNNAALQGPDRRMADPDHFAVMKKHSRL